MPIRGLTRREDVTPRFTRLGKLKKGKVEDGRPVDLDFFRFVGEGSDADIIEAAFHDAYGPEPRQVDVYLPYRTVDENWSTWMEEWGRSGLLHRCDGEIMVQWLNPDKTYTTDYEQKQRKPCPFHSGKFERTTQRPGCVAVGRLAIIIPALLEAGFVGYVTLELHSLNDLNNLTASLLDAEAKSGAALRPNGLMGIMFKLRRQAEEIGVRYAKKNGDIIKTRSTKWMVRIDPAREWVQNQLETVQQMALGQSVKRPALTVEAEAVVIEDVTPAELTPVDAEDSPFERVTGEVVEIPPEPETPPVPQTPPDDDGPDFEDGGEGGIRYLPDQLKELIQESIAKRRHAGFSLHDKRNNYLTAMVGNLESCFPGDRDASAKRHAVAWYLTGKESSKDMDDAEIKALHGWLGTTKGEDGEWSVNPESAKEAHAVYAEAMRVMGQQPLFAADDRERPFTE